MLRRGLALCLLLGMASVAKAGAVVTLVPAAPAGEFYAPNEDVGVEVYLAQEPGGEDRLLRFAQFDFSGSDTEPLIYMPITHDLAFDIRFWNFLGTPDCPTATTSTCGRGHYIEDALAGARPKVISTAYYFVESTNLSQNPNAQRTLPGNGSELKIGEFRVRMPIADGCYTFDVLNAAQTNPDLGGADIRFGFGTDVDGNPLTVWRADTGELTGSSIQLGVNMDCVGGDATLVSTAPACDTSLPRPWSNVMRLTFDRAVTLPTAADLEIRELGAGGTFIGANLADQFLFSLEGGDTILRIEENGAVFTHQTWYGITNTGAWSGVANFEVDYVVVVGNSNNDGFTDFGDLSAIFASQTDTPADDDPFNVNADAFVDFGDVSAAFSFIDSAVPAKPDGHVCTVP